MPIGFKTRKQSPGRYPHRLLGLGTCWIGAFEEEAVKSILGVPDNVRVVMLLTLGMPAEEGRPRKRKPLEELVLRERWQD